MAKWVTLQVFSIKFGLFKSPYIVIKCGYEQASDVATLALGSRPKQGLTKVRAKREARKSQLMLSGV
jgi:rRNA processing protein Gar1